MEELLKEMLVIQREMLELQKKQAELTQKKFEEILTTLSEIRKRSGR